MCGVVDGFGSFVNNDRVCVQLNVCRAKTSTGLGINRTAFRAARDPSIVAILMILGGCDY